jgi:hypothetical protein
MSSVIICRLQKKGRDWCEDLSSKKDIMDVFVNQLMEVVLWVIRSCTPYKKLLHFMKMKIAHLFHILCCEAFPDADKNAFLVSVKTRFMIIFENYVADFSRFSENICKA